MGPNGAEPAQDLGPGAAAAMPPHWYAIAVRGRCEKGVASEVRRMGVETYVPLQIVRRIWSDRIRQVEVALIPGYVFVHSPMMGRERFRILDLSDVICLVGRRGDRRGTPIPDREIESVRLLAERADSVEACPALVAGARVRVGLGPLKGAAGVVERSAGGRRRIVCAISLLGRAVRAEIDPDYLLADD